MSDILDRVLEVVEHAAAALGTGLGGDEHDTVTGLDAVDGGGGGVLQDLDGSDGLRSEVADVVDLQTVHDHERGGLGVGGITADLDRRSGTRSTGSVHDLHTGGFALQSLCDIGRRAVLKVGFLDGRNGAGDIALPLDTVTDDHGFLEHLGVLLEDDVEGGLVADGKGLGLVADALDGDG